MGNMIVSPSAVKNISTKLGDPSSASSVSGNDAFSKINTLNGNLIKYETINFPISLQANESKLVTQQWSNYVGKTVLGVIVKNASYVLYVDYNIDYRISTHEIEIAATSKYNSPLTDIQVGVTILFI